MAANTCPNCGKEVMPYRRFIREAEPFKISLCGNCGARLRRSPMVFVLLFGMLALLLVIAIPLLIWMVESGMPFWLILGSTVAILVVWVLLTSYAGWRCVGWVTVAE